MIRLIDLNNGKFLGEVPIKEMKRFLKRVLEDEFGKDKYVYLASEIIEDLDNEMYPSLKTPLSDLSLELLPDTSTKMRYGILGFEEIARDDDYCIKGKLLDVNKNTPLVGYRVEGFDKDLLSSDYLGWCYSNDKGKFALYFNEHDFKADIPIDIEKKPEIYIRILRINDDVEEELVRTEPREMQSRIIELGEIKI